ncbi:MAG TPA: DUF72 domain-containing protein [Solirubrobacteraceae bacterium]|jgi:uncharacterized protein YecE (DUF72 family)
MSGRVVVGTSSWADQGFVREWYPQGLAASQRLSYYAKYFQAVEVNSSFYRVPSRSMVARWAEVTPPGFTFDVKLHRALSRHVAFSSSLSEQLRPHTGTDDRGRVRLTKTLEVALTREFLDAVSPLAQSGKLSSLLLQLSPSFSPVEHELAELDDLIELIAPIPLAIEFRHSDWVSPEQIKRTLAFLNERDVAFVCVDAPVARHQTIMPSDISVVTSSRLAYLRAHGRNTHGYLNGRTVAERFAYRYNDQELEQIIARARRLTASLHQGETRVMLNNNRGRDAPDAASRIIELLEA